MDRPQPDHASSRPEESQPTESDDGSGKAKSGRVAWPLLTLVILLGCLIGLGTFTFGYGEGHSYLSSNPTACINCHVMQSHYDSWLASSHKDVATCNDCHLSHHPVGKWITKADNGFFHSLAFTTDSFHEPIRIKPRNRRVTQQACLHCHADFVDALLPAVHGGETVSCVSCHSSVGHAGR